MHGHRHPSHQAHMNLGQTDLLDNDEDMLHEGAHVCCELEPPYIGTLSVVS